jgi:hypothetical protein
MQLNPLAKSMKVTPLVEYLLGLGADAELRRLREKQK